MRCAPGTRQAYLGGTEETAKVASGQPSRPRAKTRSNFINTGAYAVKLLCRRMICAVKNLSLSAGEYAKKCDAINKSIVESITQKYEFKSWALQLNQLRRRAENHGIDIPCAVYKALEKISQKELWAILMTAQKNPSLEWLALLIDKVINSRTEVGTSLENGLKKSHEFFSTGLGLDSKKQDDLWTGLTQTCSDKIVIASDLDDETKKVISKAPLGQLAFLVDEADPNTARSDLLNRLSKEAINELKRRGKPLFHSAWAGELTTLELASIKKLVGQAEFLDWKKACDSEFLISDLMQKSDQEILDEIGKSNPVSSELKCVAELRMRTLRDEAINAVNRALETAVGTLGSPYQIIPALLIFDGKIDVLKKFEKAVNEDFSFSLKGVLNGVPSGKREKALACLKFAGCELKKISKLNSDEIIRFCEAEKAGECDAGDAESIRRSRNRVFQAYPADSLNEIKSVHISAEDIEFLNSKISDDIKNVPEPRSTAGGNNGVSDQFIRDLRTYHFSIGGIPFDGFNENNTDVSLAAYTEQMKALGANKNQILVTSEVVSQTSANILWNSFIAERKLFPMTKEEIDVSDFDIDDGSAYFIPGVPIQEQFITRSPLGVINVDLHFYTERLNRLGAAGDAVATEPAETHCLIKISASIEESGNFIIKNMDVRFSRKVTGAANDID